MGYLKDREEEDELYLWAVNKLADEWAKQKRDKVRVTNCKYLYKYSLN